MAGKLASWGVIGAIHPGNLVHVKDDISGASFLVDTGSSLSIKFRRPPVFLVLSFGRGGIPHPGCEFSSKISTAGGLSCSPPAHSSPSSSSPSSSSPPSSSPSPSSPSSSSPSPAKAAAVAVSQTSGGPAKAPSKLSVAEVALLDEFSSVVNKEGRLPPTTHGVETPLSPLAAQ